MSRRSETPTDERAADDGGGGCESDVLVAHEPRSADGEALYPAGSISNVMIYSIFDTGNLVASFDHQDAAYAALDRLAQESADATDRLLLLVAFDDAGNAVGDCIPGGRIANAA